MLDLPPHWRKMRSGELFAGEATIKFHLAFGAMAALSSVLATAAAAQQQAPVEVLGGTATSQNGSGPEWWAFSRSQNRNYLIDVQSVVKNGDELTVSIARVPKDTAAGDYTHSVDQFGIRCRARQSRVISSADAFEDGVPGEAFAADEPWAAIAPNSFDEAIREIGCDNMRPSPPAYPSVRAYFDAGRP